MKVLRIIWSMDPSGGGPAQGIRNSIPELEKLGTVNEVVSMDLADSSFFKQDSFTNNGVGRGKGPWKYNSHLKGWLLSNLHRFDVVILHGLWQYTSYAIYSALIEYQKKNKRQGPKLFVMPHGMLDPWFQKAKGRKLKAIRNSIFWALVEGKVVNSADAILFTCQTELLLARTTFPGYKPKKEINVGYGIQDPPGYTAEMSQAFFEKCPEVKGSSFLLFLSRINYKKGVDILVESYLSYINSVLSEGLQPKKLVIAGPELESEFGDKLWKTVSGDEQLSQYVFFPGMLTGLSKWGAFYSCDAFILPSHQENFGIAVVEALACSKPVLISDKVNIYKEILDAEAGLVENDDLSGTIKLLQDWHGMDADTKQSMRVNARNAFIEKFAIKSAAQQLHDALQN